MTISTRYSSRPDFRTQPKTQSLGDTAASRVEQSPTPTTSTATDPGATNRAAPTGHSAHSSFEPAPADAPVSLTTSEPTLGFRDQMRRMMGRPPFVPTEFNSPEVRADEAQRNPALARRQEQIVSGAGSEPVQFTNANGQTEALQFTRESDGIRVTDAHNNSMFVHAEEGLSQEELVRGTAAFADYWSQYPEHLRGATPQINLHPGKIRGDFTNTTQEMNMGVRDDLDEMTFDHEFGHAVGFELDINNGRPAGWDAAMQADGVSPSQYANNDGYEDFAEAWLTYVDAREKSPEHLAAIQRQFPNRFALLEQIYNGTPQP